jgi:uncharacterized protein (TIGR02996 family)
MTSADELLQAIIANPDDDQLRLVYADALTQAGHPQGEYIACVLGGQHERAAALVAKHRRLFTDGLRGPKLSEHAFDFARGMVERVEMTTDELAQLDRIRARAPLRAMHLRGGDGPTIWPASMPPLRRVTTYYVDDDDLIGLARRLAGSLEELELVGATMQARVAIELVESAPRLRLLALGDVAELGPDAMQAIVRLPLEELTLRKLAPGALAALRVAPTSLRAFVFDPSYALNREELRAWDGPARLEKLVLTHGSLGVDGLRALVASPMVRDVVELHLAANRLGDEGIAVLAAAALPRLRHLTLGWNRLRRPIALVESPAFGGLTHLGLDFAERNSDEANVIDADVADAIRARHGEALRRLT